MKFGIKRSSWEYAYWFGIYFMNNYYSFEIGISFGNFCLRFIWDKKIVDSEEWIFNNPDILASIQRGLSDAKQGKVSKIDLNKL